MRLTKVLCGALIGLCACSGSEDFEQGEGTLRVRLQVDPQVTIALKSTDVASYSLEVLQ